MLCKHNVACPTSGWTLIFVTNNSQLKCVQCASTKLINTYANDYKLYIHVNVIWASFYRRCDASSNALPNHQVFNHVTMEFIIVW